MATELGDKFRIFNTDSFFKYKDYVFWICCGEILVAIRWASSWSSKFLEIWSGWTWFMESACHNQDQFTLPTSLAKC